MSKCDNYTLLYNNLWLYKLDNSSIVEVIDDQYDLDERVLTGESLLISNGCVDAVVTSSEAEKVIVRDEGRDTKWDALVGEVNNCKKCGLCHTRQNVVIERGNRGASWMFIGEAPGQTEDLQGLPFVGKAGMLLQKMIKAMKLNPEVDVYVCNVIKCRPPMNRNPQTDEISACKNYLLRQIELVKPKIIVTLGRFAFQTLLNTTAATTKFRGAVHFYSKIPLIVTYHPSYLLRNPSAKKDAWLDLQLAMHTFEKLAYET